MAPSAIVLVSGGLDSATALACAREQGFECHALTFGYGQRHAIEVESARRVAESLGARSHRIIEIDLKVFGGSALTSQGIPVPKGRPLRAIEAGGIPSTYVPARNTIFLAYALAWAEVLPARDIFLGTNVLDSSGYPDCRDEFVRAFEAAARLGSRMVDLAIHAPLSKLTKAQIIERGQALGVNYAMTHSCYDPSDDGGACGACDACLLRKKGFEQAGLADPTRYAR